MMQKMPPPKIATIAAAIAAIFLTLLSPFNAVADEVYDPLEPLNRKVFWFNEQMDAYVLEPLAKGYDWATPDSVQRSIGNFFENVRFPIFLVSDLLQGKISQAGTHTGRFVINSTVGILGLFDVATDFGLERNYEDFGLMLAYNGVGDGCYLVVPLFGPMNLRDGFGRLVDSFITPFNYVAYTNTSSAVQWGVPVGARVAEGIHDRAQYADAIKSAKAAAIDYYFTQQGAYYQYRRGLLYDGHPPDEEE